MKLDTDPFGFNRPKPSRGGLWRNLDGSIVPFTELGQLERNGIVDQLVAERAKAPKKKAKRK